MYIYIYIYTGIEFFPSYDPLGASEGARRSDSARCGRLARPVL